jgi:hypothetical protein
LIKKPRRAPFEFVYPNQSPAPHLFRATGITAYLENGGTIEHAQQMAAHDEVVWPNERCDQPR